MWGRTGLLGSRNRVVAWTRAWVVHLRDDVIAVRALGPTPVCRRCSSSFGSCDGPSSGYAGDVSGPATPCAACAQHAHNMHVAALWDQRPSVCSRTCMTTCCVHGVHTVSGGCLGGVRDVLSEGRLAYVPCSAATQELNGRVKTTGNYRVCSLNTPQTPLPDAV